MEHSRLSTAFFRTRLQAKDMDQLYNSLHKQRGWSERERERKIG